MLDNLINLVKEHAGDAIINNKAIPNENNNKAIETTASSIVEALKGQVSGGNVSDLAGLFSGKTGGTSGGIMDAITGNVTKNLVSKLGIDNAAASGVAASLIPTVMKSLVKKTNDPNDKSFDLGGIVNSLGGNAQVLSTVTSMLGGQKAGGIMGMVKGLFGGK